MCAKIVVFIRFKHNNVENLSIFKKICQKVLVVSEKVVPLHPQNRTRMFDCMTLGYGVMVTLQILVLSFLVRVRVPQLHKIAK